MRWNRLFRKEPDFATFSVPSRYSKFARSPAMVLLCTTMFWAAFVSLSAFNRSAAFVELPQLSTMFPTKAKPRSPISALTETIALVALPLLNVFHPKNVPVMAGRLPIGARRVNSPSPEQPSA